MNWKKIINLSPLVDVLMIVIFWYIMMSNQTMEETKEAAQNELNAMQNRYETELAETELQKVSLEEQVQQLSEEAKKLLEEKGDEIISNADSIVLEVDLDKQGIRDLLNNLNETVNFADISIKELPMDMIITRIYNE